MSKQIPDGERQFAVQTALSEVGLMFDGLTPKKNVKEAMAIWLHGNLPHQLVPEADLRILLRQTQDNIRQYRQELLVPPINGTCIIIRRTFGAELHRTSS